VVRSVAQVLTAGTVLGTRYRLERLVAGDLAPAGTGLWRAEDLTLSRPVAVRVVVDGPDSGDAARRALLAAASAASRAHHRAIAATYDADQTRVGDDPVAYLVREWVPGRSLRSQLVDGGMDPNRLVAVLRQTAEAVAALHATGSWHGRIHPDNVVVLPDDTVRLTDHGTSFALAAAGVPQRDGNRRPTVPPELLPAVVADLLLGTRPTTVPQDATAAGRLRRYDGADLGRVLYAGATGAWVGGAWRGMRAAPTDGERPRRARQVRAAVSRDLDGVIGQCLLPSENKQPLEAGALAAALGRIDTMEHEQGRSTRAAAPARNAWRLRAVLLAAVVVLGIVGFVVGRQIGSVPGTAQPTFPAAPSVTGSAAPAGSPIALQHVAAFDPPPGDGTENDDEVPLAYDGSTATAWQTERYSSADLGGLKTGVGLLVDLGSIRHVSTVQLDLTGGTTGVQLRAADASSTALAGYPVVASASGTTVTLTVDASHRYWLVWLTSLPKTDGGYRGGIAELVFHS
jgi:hypothetical protein